MSNAQTPERPKSQSQASAPKFKPFSLVFDNGTNGTMVLPAVNGYKMRMRWLRSNLLNRRDRKGQVIGRDMGKLSSMPDIPGQVLTIKPHATKVGWVQCDISDPLEDQPETLQRITASLSQASVIGSDSKRKAAPETSFELDADNGKTFLMALRGLVDDKTAHEVRNTACPTDEEIAGLAGEEIYDPVNPLSKKRVYVRDVVGAAG